MKLLISTIFLFYSIVIFSQEKLYQVTIEKDNFYEFYNDSNKIQKIKLFKGEIIDFVENDNIFTTKYISGKTLFIKNLSILGKNEKITPKYLYDTNVNLNVVSISNIEIGVTSQKKQSKLTIKFIKDNELKGEQEFCFNSNEKRNFTVPKDSIDFLIISTPDTNFVSIRVDFNFIKELGNIKYDEKSYFEINKSVFHKDKNTINLENIPQNFQYELSTVKNPKLDNSDYSIIASDSSSNINIINLNAFINTDFIKVRILPSKDSLNIKIFREFEVKVVHNGYLFGDYFLVIILVLLITGSIIFIYKRKNASEKNDSVKTGEENTVDNKGKNPTDHLPEDSHGLDKNSSTNLENGNAWDNPSVENNNKEQPKVEFTESISERKSSKPTSIQILMNKTGEYSINEDFTQLIKDDIKKSVQNLAENIFREIENRLTTKIGEINKLESENKSLNNRLDSIQKEKNDLESKNTNLENINLELSKKFRDIKNYKTRLEEKVSTLETSISEYEVKEKKIKNIESENLILKGKLNKYSELFKLTKDNDNYLETFKTLNKLFADFNALAIKSISPGQIGNMYIVLRFTRSYAAISNLLIIDNPNDKEYKLITGLSSEILNTTSLNIDINKFCEILYNELEIIVPSLRRFEYLYKNSNLKSFSKLKEEDFHSMINIYDDILKIIKDKLQIEVFDAVFGLKKDEYKNIENIVKDILNDNHIKISDYYPGLKHNSIYDLEIIDIKTSIIKYKGQPIKSDYISPIFNKNTGG